MKFAIKIGATISMEGNDVPGSSMAFRVKIPILNENTTHSILDAGQVALMAVHSALHQEVIRVGRVKTFVNLTLQIICEQSKEIFNYMQRDTFYAGMSLENNFANCYEKIPTIVEGIIAVQILDALTESVGSGGRGR